MDKKLYRSALFAVDLYFGYRLDRVARLAEALAPETVGGWFERALRNPRNGQLRFGVSSLVARRLAEGGTEPLLFEPALFLDLLAETMGPAHREAVGEFVAFAAPSLAAPVTNRLVRALAHRRYWVTPLRAAAAVAPERRQPSGGCAPLPLAEYDRYAAQLGPRRALVAQTRADAAAALVYCSRPEFWSFVGGAELAAAGLNPRWVALLMDPGDAPVLMDRLVERFVRHEVNRVFGRP